MKRWWTNGTEQKLIEDTKIAPEGFHLGRLPESAATKAKKRASMRGLKKSETHKAKIAAALKGKPSGMLGKHQSDATKRKQSLAKIGNNNPMYGSHKTTEQKIAQSKRSRGEKNGRWHNTEAADKAKQTIMLKYGCGHAPTNWYVYEGMSFDSFPELCFYLYNKRVGNGIIREPRTFEYEFAGKILVYVPDFEVNGELYELKGDQFLAEDGTWKCPYKDDFGKSEAKRQCALAHNVRILYKKDYRKYVDWFYEAGYNKEEYRKKR